MNSRGPSFIKASDFALVCHPGSSFGERDIRSQLSKVGRSSVVPLMEHLDRSAEQGTAFVPPSKNGGSCASSFPLDRWEVHLEIRYE